jgi:putative ABC transport system permease protein
MIRNYLKIAFRNLLRNGAFSVINICGLAIGMASAVLILLWIQNEVSYDQFHEKKDRIYEAWNRAHFDGKLMCWNSTPKILARTIEHDLPEVERAVRVQWESNFLLTVGEKKITGIGTLADTGFLQMFSFPLIKGNASTALNDMHSIVLTETLAKILFGNQDAMGKIIKLDNTDNFTVTGIVKDLPNNTRFKFECLLPWSYWYPKDDDFNWGNNSTQTYVLLKQNASYASVASKIKILKQKYDEEAKKDKWEMFIYPISRWRLYSSFTNGVEDNGGRMTFVKLFGTIAAFILLIACINFMNLSTARSEKRAKEVGIRKVVGAQKGALVGQFIGESILIAFLAAIVALLIVELSLPGFNRLTDKKLFIDFSHPGFWFAGICFIIGTGIIAGSYPAFFLSSFQPIKVLKGLFRASHALVTPRKVLVIVQFTFAIALIICTLIVKNQIDYAKKRQAGYDKNNLVYHFITGDLGKNYTLVKNELLASGVASSVTKTSAPLTQGWSDSWDFVWSGKMPGDKTDFDRFCVDEGIVATAGFKLLQGRDFDLKQFPSDSTAVILNESAVKTMNFKEPLGQIIKDIGIEWHVIGVISDFILQSPYQPLKPMVIEGGKGWFNTIHVKLSDQRTTAQNLAAMGSIFKKYNPEYPFEYHFIDKEYASKFEDEKRTGTLAALFAGLTIFISCLGLFGLAAYMAQNRIKEIGVRKVLGASVASIATLLSKDFLKLVVISLIIASPLAGYAMYRWLMNYPYHVDIDWWVFAIAGIGAMVIALFTISFQAIRAAVASPVKNLRTE